MYSDRYDDIHELQKAARERGRHKEERKKAEMSSKTLESAEATAEGAVLAQAKQVRKCSSIYVSFRKKLKDAAGKLSDMIEANPKLDDSDPIQMSRRLSVVVFGWGGAYGFDVLLIGAFSSYWLSMQSVNVVIHYLSKAVLPFLILGLEIALLSMLVSAILHRKMIQRVLIGMLCVFIVIVFGWFAAAMVMAYEEVSSISEMDSTQIGILLLAVLSAVLPHIVILGGGLAGYEGKAMLFVSFYRHRVRKYGRKVRKHLDNILEEFNELTRCLDAHKKKYPDKVWNLTRMFSAETRDVINQALDYEAIPVPMKNSTNSTVGRTQTEPNSDEQEVG
ncbi:MAG: hypothetical protein BMS9Abin05_2688 [Rhodothermia bacterium]|nr:MAG: hypothetical protein BMS9Abin05_2688 [Rhodothermia bacterium]